MSEEIRGSRLECAADIPMRPPKDNVEPPPPTGDPGRSLIREVELLREQVQQLCAAVRGLVQLQSVLNQAVQQLLKRDGVGSDCAVL